LLANFLIGLREGLEAALIVGILVAYLVKLNQHKGIRALWIGVFSAIAVSIGIGLFLTYVVEEVPEGTNEIIAGSASIIAVVFVTWMIFWMAKQSKNLGGELRGRIDKVKEGSAVGLAAVAFFAVIREGAETSVFIWTAARSTGTDTNPVLGAILGLPAAAVLGYFIYRGAVKLNLSVFFRYTGAFLVIVAAGILAYGVHEFQEIGLLPFLTATTYDVSNVVVKGGVLDTILRGTISFRAAPSQLETLLWALYFVPTAIIFWNRSKSPKKVAA
jgi:high-affinity iron transporter